MVTNLLVRFARAANELTRMGYYEEAKALMLGKEIFQEEKIDD